MNRKYFVLNKGRQAVDYRGKTTLNFIATLSECNLMYIIDIL